jgi:hypothetical protein
MRPFDGRRVLLGITGGIASYKAAWLARLLQQAGALVDVVMTRSATEFVGAVTIEALTGRPVHTALIAPGHALDHIRLARAAEVVVVAPATADFLARAAHGHADDLLSACLLATGAPVLLVPAMNDRMWAHPAVARNAAAARELGYHVLDPDDGNLAVGEGSGPGRMPEPEAILAHVGRLLEPAGALAGRGWWSPPAPRASRSTRCATCPTIPAAGWAWPSPPPPGDAAPTCRSSPGRFRCRCRRACASRPSRPPTRWLPPWPPSCRRRTCW